jgi:hypothetical protein
VGAGSTSALIVFANYVAGQIGKPLPSEVMAAAAPLVSFVISYFIAAAKYFRSAVGDWNDKRKLKREIETLIKLGVEPDVEKRLRSQLTEIQFLSVEARRVRIIARHEEAASSVSSGLGA